VVEEVVVLQGAGVLRPHRVHAESGEALELLELALVDLQSGDGANLSHGFLRWFRPGRRSECLHCATSWQSTRLVVKYKQFVMPLAEPRSYCPINLSLEIFGDSWTLLVLRDMMFSGKRHFRELLQSDERISSNILAERLARLVAHGLLTKSDDPTHKQKA